MVCFIPKKENAIKYYLSHNFPFFLSLVGILSLLVKVSIGTFLFKNALKHKHFVLIIKTKQY